MSEIYVPSSREGYELCHPIHQEDFEAIDVQIDGTPRRKTWRPIPMFLVHADEGMKLLPSDAPWLGSNALIFRQSVLEKIGLLLEEHGELLPVDCSEAKLSLFNATRVLDALDEEASSVTRFSGGRIMRVTRYMFQSKLIAGNDIFKISNLRVSPTFFSKHAVQSWTSSGLQGLAFTKIWSE